MKKQEEGVVTLKDEQNKLIAIIYKDGSSAPVIYMTEPADVDQIKEILK